MERKATTPRSERAAALTAVIALHILVLLALMAIRPGAPNAVAKMPGLSVFSLPGERVLTTPRPPAIRSKMPDALLLAALADPAAKSAASAASAPGASCATLEQVTASLLADPAAVDAVVQSPIESRSITDAIIIWNAGWSNAALTIDAPLAPARSAVERTLATLTEACLDEDVTGPRLVPIPAGEGTTFLVIGSGVWRWRGLLADPALTPPAISRDTQVFSGG